MSRTIIDIHILHTVPPSNVNRDDTGSPKTAVYGGVRRARVSSQAWKRATRLAFNETLDASQLGIRTKRVVDLVAHWIEQTEPSLADRALELAEAVIKAADITVAKPRGNRSEAPPEAGYLVFVSAQQARRLADVAISAALDGRPVDKEKKAARAALGSGHSVDIALFGRMVADVADLNVDAAAQVAHAISVHGVDNEYDYFTAVDDAKTGEDDDAGAAMIGTVEFNSSTLYRYATVDVDGLRANLCDEEATVRAVGAFVRAFVTSMPTGKQNTFANRTLPDGVVALVRDRQPINLAGAFEEAVEARDGTSRLAVASERLVGQATSVDAAYSQPPVASFVVRAGTATAPLAELGDETTLDGLVGSLESLVRERLREPA